MTVKEVLPQFESLGEEAPRKHNAKAGAPANQFGVKLGDIRMLAKKIKTITSSLSSSGRQATATTQLLAMLIIKPMSLSGGELDKLVRSVTFAQVAEWPVRAFFLLLHRGVGPTIPTNLYLHLRRQ